MRATMCGVLMFLSAVDVSAQQPPAAQPGVPQMKRNDEIAGRTLEEWVKLASDPDPSVKENALRAIALYGPMAQAKGSAALVAAMNAPANSDLGPRVAAIMAIGSVGLDKEFLAEGIKGLRAQLRSPTTGLRMQAAITLMAFGPDAADAVPDLIPLLRDEAWWEIRKSAANALGRVANRPDAGPDRAALLALANVLRDKAAPVRQAALSAFVQLGPPSSRIEWNSLRQAIVERIANEKDPAISIIARVALMRFDQTAINDTQLAPIGKSLKNPDPQVQNVAAQALGMVGPAAKSQVEPLVEALKSPHYATVGMAIWALGQIGPDAKSAIEPLNEFARHQDEGLRSAATLALDKIYERKKFEDPFK